MNDKERILTEWNKVLDGSKSMLYNEILIIFFILNYLEQITSLGVINSETEQKLRVKFSKKIEVLEKKISQEKHMNVLFDKNTILIFNQTPTSNPIDIEILINQCYSFFKTRYSRYYNEYKKIIKLKETGNSFQETILLKNQKLYSLLNIQNKIIDETNLIEDDQLYFELIKGDLISSLAKFSSQGEVLEAIKFIKNRVVTNLATKNHDEIQYLLEKGVFTIFDIYKDTKELNTKGLLGTIDIKDLISSYGIILNQTIHYIESIYIMGMHEIFNKEKPTKKKGLKNIFSYFLKKRK